MTIDSEILIQDLIERTRKNMNQARKFNQFGIEALNQRPEQNSWSILECLEHLNLYGDFYVPEIKKRIETSNTDASKIFKSGIVGNYFAKSMLPKEKLNKMKTFDSMNPLGKPLTKSTIERFISQQEQLLNLLDQARKIDLNRTKTAISLTKWIKLKLGDTFRIVIYHNDRHIAQATKVEMKVGK